MEQMMHGLNITTEPENPALLKHLCPTQALQPLRLVMCTTDQKKSNPETEYI